METLGFADLFSTLTYAVVIATSLFILDDLFIDFVAFVKRLRPTKLTTADIQCMRGLSEKHIAIMIANWKEAEVIGPMIRGNIRGIDYDNYTFFLGVYPNDTETWAEASRLEKMYPDKVVVVVNSQPGPYQLSVSPYRGEECNIRTHYRGV